MFFNVTFTVVALIWLWGMLKAWQHFAAGPIAEDNDSVTFAFGLMWPFIFGIAMLWALAALAWHKGRCVVGRW